MPIRGKLISPTMRLNLGESVLSAASLADTRLVAKRVARFRRAHRRYVAAHRDVAAVAHELRDARAHLSRCDKVQGRSIELLACALVYDGHRRRNPFLRFRVPSPSRFMRLPVAKEAQAVRRLVAAIRESKHVGEGTLGAARTAEQAARTVQQAIVDIGKVEDRLRAARVVREALKHEWHSAYAALARGARAAADDGAPRLHASLFVAARPRKRRRSARVGRRGSRAAATEPER